MYYMNRIIQLLLVLFGSSNALLLPSTIKIAFKHANTLTEEPYSTLMHKIDENKVSEIIFSTNLDSAISHETTTTGDFISDFAITKINPFVVNIISENAAKHGIQIDFLQADQQKSIIDTAGAILNTLGNFIFPILLLTYVVAFFRSRGPGGGGPMGPMGPMGGGFPGGLRKDIIEAKEQMKKANVSLSSFAGSPEIMEECFEIVSYLKNSTMYENAGAEIPRGILLEGPPGSGKTLLAKAIASEANANFINIAASEFVEIFVGVGASKIRALFEMARKNVPCILFIDEIDAVGRQRGAGVNMANDEREQTLNQLLAEMDGFGDNTGILVMAATNRKDVLDQALLRPGRFDRILTVPYPDRDSRKAILKVHAKNKKLAEDINLDFVAELTAGFSGAQLKNLLNEAAIYAARESETTITTNNILNALDKLIVGLVKKQDIRSDESLRRVAIHETGHALLAANFTEYFELKKVTIQSTYSGAGGYTIFNEYTNITDSGLYTKDLLKKRLVVTMGGKAAESIAYGDDHVSLGAVQDLKQANSLAQQMIGNYGMGDELEVFYNENVGDSRNPFLGRSMAMGGGYSENTKTVMDRESLNLVIDAYADAKRILTENRDAMETMVQTLLKNTTILGSDVRKLM
jgi:cell division protease FtsH